MATPKAILRPCLNSFNQPLTLHPGHNKTNHRHPYLSTSRWLADDRDPVMRNQEPQQDALQAFLMRDHGRPRCAGVCPKVRHHGGDTLGELVVG